jgi:hypothetical protein
VDCPGAVPWWIWAACHCGLARTPCRCPHTQELLEELVPQWYTVSDLGGQAFVRIDNTVSLEHGYLGHPLA